MITNSIVSTQGGSSVEKVPKQIAPINNRFPASLPKPWLEQWNEDLEKKTSITRIEWTMENLPSQFVLSSSFGI